MALDMCMALDMRYGARKFCPGKFQFVCLPGKADIEKTKTKQTEKTKSKQKTPLTKGIGYARILR